MQQLRGNDLYDAASHAYVPSTGPGRGEAPTARIVDAKRQAELIIMDITVESKYAPAYTLELTVRKDANNQLAGIRFISLLPKPLK